MSILIKGMDMPTNCENCRLWYQDQDSEHNVWSRCTALNHNEIIAFRTIRRADCPLVEVPTPHGRLIDADKLPVVDFFDNEDCPLMKAPEAITDEIAQKITEEANKACANCQEWVCDECEYRHWRSIR